MATIYLIDGSAYIHRAFHAIAPLGNSAGQPTNAVFGFFNILRRLFKERSPEFLAMAYDTRGPVFRHDLYSAYKANRPPMAAELASQIPFIRELVAAHNILCLERDDLEADDLIAAASTRMAAQGHEVVIVSGDKDLLQLVGERVTLWDPMNDRIMDQAGVRAKYGVDPERLLDCFALMGDSSDNVPGVPGIGPKTASRLISEYGSLEGLFAAIAGMKPSKTRERLEAHQEDALLSRRLIRLDTAAEVPTDLEAYRLPQPDTARLRRLYALLEFKSLLGEEAPGRPVDASGFALVDSEAGLDDLVRRLAATEQIVIDTETSSLDPLVALLVGISLCVDDQAAWYLPIGHRDDQGRLLAGQLDCGLVIERLRPLLEDEGRAKIGHNLKFDLAVLAAPHNGGIRLGGPLLDTMIAAYLLQPEGRSYKLDDLCREIGLELTSFATVTDGDRRGDAFVRVPIDRARDYSCEDVHGAWKLLEHSRPRLEELGLWPLFAEVEGPLVRVLAAMEGAGIAIDREALALLSREFGLKLDCLEREIHGLAGHPFNINSPQQLGQILFEEQGLPRGRKTKTGYSTDVKVLEQLQSKHPLPARILEYRNLAKLKSTYVDKLPGQVSVVDGRIHTSFNQCGTATGRLSSSNPNLQNIPIRSEEGRRIRAAFVAAPGSMLLSADYSQIDLRVLAHYSGDTALVSAFREDRDVHQRTAAEIFLVDPLLVNAEMRRVAKSINFGIVYGMSAFGLAKQLDIGRKEAQTFIDRYFAIYKGVQQFMTKIVAEARKHGHVTTLLGRRRPLADIDSPNRNLREFAERTAINTPIQGSAADLIKLAMLRVDEELRRQGLGGRMLLQIHDELVVEAPENEVEQTADLLRTAMEGVMKLTVPLKVNVGVGQDLAKD